jgi:hypothetical protein
MQQHNKANLLHYIITMAILIRYIKLIEENKT